MASPAAASLDEPSTAPAALKGLIEELNDLKRVRSAGREGSIAQRLFRQAWGALVAGEAPERVTVAVTASAIAAARLGDLDVVKLRQLGLSSAEAANVLARAFDEVARPVASPLRALLRDALGLALPASAAPPPFVGLLENQPRAGVTCPGRARVVLEPPENHAEHCLMVAVYGVILSPAYGADPTTVFVAGLAHHLHNALMPDSGFTGETLLGRHLDEVMQRATLASLDELGPALRAEVERARDILPDADTPDGRAFHAADVIDRVLQIAQHLRAASLTMAQVLDEMELVHDGPVKPFHDRVLQDMQLP